MKINNILGALIILLTIFSCKKSEIGPHKNSNIDSYEVTESGNANQLNIDKKNIPQNRKIIWTGDLELQVKNVDEVTKNIGILCNKYNAFVSKMNLTNNNYEISNRITIRVKNEKFNTLIDEIKGNSIYTRKVEISSDDVTEEFVDIESRLKTKKEVRQRYINILKTKTGKISDVIEAEEAIRKITEEIEAKEGRLRFLKDLVSFSTINLQLFQKVDYRREPEVFEKTFISKAIEALKNGWTFVTNLFLGLLNIWPLLILLTIFLWKKKWIKSLFQKKK